MPVVISRALVLSHSVEGRADAPLIGWQNFVTVQNISADEEAPGYPVTNMANPSTALRWEGETTGEQFITVDLMGAGDVDYVGIARHNLGSGLVTVSVEASDGGSPAVWTEVFNEIIPASDKPIVLHFEAAPYPEIRVRLQPTSAAPRIAVLYVGKLLRLPRGIHPGLVPPTWGLSDDVVDAQSEAGDYLGQIVLRQSLQTSVSVQWIDYDWWNANMPGFVEHARQRKPFFFAWLPASYPNEVGYAWLQSDIRPEAENYSGGVAVHMNLDMRAVNL